MSKGLDVEDSLVPAKEDKYIVLAHQLVPTIPTRTFSITVS